MTFSNSFLISCRMASLIFMFLVAYSFNVGTLTYQVIFVGLLFSHWAFGFYYSKNNIKLMKDKKYALILATGLLLVGLYFSIYAVHFAPYFLVLHVALSDAYLLTFRSKAKDPEYIALLRTVFYVICFGLIVITLNQLTVTILLIVGLLAFAAIFSYAEDKLALLLFEIPLLAIVLYLKINQMTLHIHFIGFYHILTWYVFSFWMLFVREKNTKKTISFFSTVIAVSAAFVLLFTAVLDISITEKSFMKIIGFWSILHVVSTIPLSKFNPRVIKNLFYSVQR